MTEPEVPRSEASSDDTASEESSRPPDAERGVYGISVAADLVGMGVQNLRLYESRGLLQPARTEGGTRRYSENDLKQLRRIGDLLDAGLNLAGIGMVIDLENENTRLRRRSGTRLRRQSGQTDKAP
jgi:MerR family transcriptional regulator, heat shock protein HspR